MGGIATGIENFFEAIGDLIAFVILRKKMVCILYTPGERKQLLSIREGWQGLHAENWLLLTQRLCTVVSIDSIHNTTF